jgi:hypothetical protein
MRPAVRFTFLGIVCATVGCYTLQPTGGVTPQYGRSVGLDINDAGRVALGGAMGPSIERIEGRLVSRDSSEYVVAVTDVHLLGGDDQVWSGETVHIRTDYVTALYERRLSVARSIALGAAGVGVVAALASATLAGFGSTDRTTENPGDTSHTQRIPQRIPLRIPRP